MKYRAVEILFRRKILILLPVVMVTIATTALAARPQPVRWQAFAAVWVDPSKYLSTDGLPSTATTQAQLINDFIHTRTFSMSVLKQTALAPLLDNPVTQLGVVGQFQGWTHTAASGSFVTIVATTPDPDLSYKLVQAVISSFQDILQGQSDNQAQAAISVYGNALKDAQSALAQSQSDLAAYISAHPELAQAVGDGGARPADLDPAYANLVNQVSNNQQNYNALQQRLTSIQQTAAAGREGLPFSFTLVDEPQRPLYPLGISRLNRIKLPGIGVVVGLLLSGALAALLILTNRTILGAPDVETALGVPVLGEIRSMRSRRWPWQRRVRQYVRLKVTAAARPGVREVRSA